MEGYIAQIILFAGNFAPRSWAFCSGQLLAIAQNTALFSLLGTTYGGDGQTTFGLPDLRGRVPVGPGTGPGLPNVDLGEIAGVNTNTLTTAQMPAHSHTVQAQLKGTSLPASLGSPDNVVFATNDNVSLYSRNTSGMDLTFNPASLSVTAGSAGGSQPVGNMQPYLGLNYIICLEGIYPSRS